MTTVADGLHQYGGMPVGFDGLYTKIFSTPNGTAQAKGRAWFVDASSGTNGDGTSPKNAFSTMQRAFNNLASGDIIYFVGKITEQLVTPVQVFDVTIVGAGNSPRHADATPAGGSWAASQWGAPTTPVSGQALCRVLQQGWRFINVLFAPAAGLAAIEFVRNAASGNDERDASHAQVLGCKFAGVLSTDSGIKFGSTSFTEIVNNVLIEGNYFLQLAHGIKDHAANLAIYAKIINNRFELNTNDIVLRANRALIKDNVMSLAPTGSIVISGGVGSSQVHGNYLPGTYTTGALYAEGSGDDWNGNYASTGVTAAVP